MSDRNQYRLAYNVTTIKDGVKNTTIPHLHKNHVQGEDWWNHYQKNQKPDEQIIDLTITEINPMLKEYNRFFTCEDSDSE